MSYNLQSNILQQFITMMTDGNDPRLEKSQVKYDLRKFGFTNRVVNTWNSLPNWVVSANTTTFKTRLDKFWQNQDIIQRVHEKNGP